MSDDKKKHSSKKTSDLKDKLKEISESAFKDTQAERIVKGRPQRRRKRLVGLKTLGSRPSLPNSKPTI
jgi:hypothetical protein